MRAPGFWSASKPGWQAQMLAPLGWIYGRLTLARMRKPGLRADVPVISVGNFTAGGAGKTPTTLAIAERLAARGEKPAIITRGYRGSATGPLRVDAAQHHHTEVGDEALMMAAQGIAGAMIIVSRDRAAGAKLATQSGATCLILDDGLQNPALDKDLSVAVIDGGAGFGNGCVVPAGPLRAPLAEQSRFVRDIVLVGPDIHAVAANLPSEIAIHTAEIIPDASAEMAVRGQKVLAFCGIGRPGKFIESLQLAGADILASRDFPDHHAFTPGEARALLAEARQLHALPVTTAKDHVRLRGDPDLQALANASMVFSIRYRLAPALEARVLAAIDAFSGNRG